MRRWLIQSATRSATVGIATANDPEADQIRRNKMRDFVEAVKAKTEVSLPNQLGRSTTAGNTPQTRDENAAGNR
ncbi:hypothetical protein [Escherichia coli]|uniref:hypothetical protein n=1 Tax=Escherichia coli TaxID=562 RepID=UPI00389098C6